MSVGGRSAPVVALGRTLLWMGPLGLRSAEFDVRIVGRPKRAVAYRPATGILLSMTLHGSLTEEALAHPLGILIRSVYSVALLSLV